MRMLRLLPTTGGSIGLDHVGAVGVPAPKGEHPAEGGPAHLRTDVRVLVEMENGLADRLWIADRHDEALDSRAEEVLGARHEEWARQHATLEEMCLAAEGADLHGLWQGLLTSNLQVWQALRPQVFQEMAARRTDGGREAVIAGQVPADFAPTMPPPPATPWDRDFLNDATNFFAAWSDGLTFGMTQKLRMVLGLDQYVDRNSEAYAFGSAVAK